MAGPDLLSSEVALGESTDRSRERYSRAARGFVSALLGRSVSVLVSLVTIPITLPYLGPERFGMWMTVTSLAILAAFLDLGLGLALMNAIAAAHGRRDPEAQRAAFTNAVAASVVMAAVSGVVLLGVASIVDWPAVLNVSGTAAAPEARSSMLAIILIFVVGLPLGLANSVWNGLQRTYVPNLAIALGAVLGLLGVIASVQLGLGVPALVAAASGGPLVASLASFALLYLKHPDLRPGRALLSSLVARRLVAAGVSFLVLELAVAIANGSNPLVLTRVLGPGAVAEYSVVNRIYAIPYGISVALITVLWPAFREAASRGDRAWVVRAFRQAVAASLLTVAPFSLAAIVLGPPIVSLMTAGRVSADSALFAAFGASTIAFALANCLSVLLNSASIVWPQALIWGLMAVANVSLSIVLASRIGIAGVVWASAITVGLMIVPLTYVVTRRYPLRTRLDVRR